MLTAEREPPSEEVSYRNSPGEQPWSPRESGVRQSGALQSETVTVVLSPSSPQRRSLGMPCGL